MVGVFPTEPLPRQGVVAQSVADEDHLTGFLEPLGQLGPGIQQGDSWASSTVAGSKLAASCAVVVCSALLISSFSSTSSRTTAGSTSENRPSGRRRDNTGALSLCHEFIFKNHTMLRGGLFDALPQLVRGRAGHEPQPAPHLPQELGIGVEAVKEIRPHRQHDLKLVLAICS